MHQHKPKILIIDDDSLVTGMLRIALEDARFQVAVAHNGREGLRAAYDQHPNLVLLDIAMPGLDGFQVLEYLRAVTDIPIIMLTAVTQDAHRIRGMDKGATDFIPKDTSMDVLLAHIRARLRSADAKRPSQTPRRYDENLEVDVMRRHVRVQDETVTLTPLQWRLLMYLVEHEGRVATYRNLLDAGWDDLEYGDMRGVKVQISHLRVKLRDTPKNSRYIHTIREEGYMFEVRPG